MAGFEGEGFDDRFIRIYRAIPVEYSLTRENANASVEQTVAVTYLQGKRMGCRTKQGSWIGEGKTER